MKVFTLYVGTGFDKDHAPIHAPAMLSLVKSKLAEQYGGYSLDEVKGGYMHADGKLAEEPSARIEVLVDDNRADEFKQTAKWVRDLFQQESVLLNCQTVESAFI